MISTTLTTLGFLLLLHAGYSVSHFRSLLTFLGVAADSVSVPPMDVWVEVLAGLALCLVGGIIGVGKLVS